MLYGFFVIEFQKILCHYLFKYFSFSSILGLQLDMCQTDLSGLHLISQFSRPESGTAQFSWVLHLQFHKFQCVCRAVLPSGASGHGSASRLIQVVGSIQFLTVGKLRCPFPFPWLSGLYPEYCLRLTNSLQLSLTCCAFTFESH